MKIKVTYKGFDQTIDNILIDTLTDVGFKFDGSGFNIITDERDICFDNEIKENK